MRITIRLVVVAGVFAAAGCSDASGPGDPENPVNSGPIKGDGSALVAEMIPRISYVARDQDFSVTHPALHGVPVSFNTIALVFAQNVTVAQANDLIAGSQATMVGGIPGKAGVTSGIVFLRLNTATHQEMILKLNQLRADSRVSIVTQDVQLSPAVVPNSPATNAALSSWTWEVTPTGGNWGLEAIRAPQMWALNNGITKGAGPQPITLVLDNGFDAAHEDLGFANLPTSTRSHGTHVSGTIAAKFSNGRGVDGVNPFTVLTASSFISWGTMTSQLDSIIRATPQLRVINTSLAYNWISGNASPINFSSPDSGGAAQTTASSAGAIIHQMLKTLEATGTALPVWVTASGNDSNKGFGDQFAVWASPIANAAIEHGAKNIIVVEAVDKAASGSQPLSRAPFSNRGGHVSAPGVGIVSTDSLPVGYSSKNGTSMATPHVAGVVGYLYALDPALPRPTLSSNPVLDLLIANGNPAQNTRPSIDAYATALDVDRIQNSSRVLKMLVDIDDGTPDGNLRMNADNSINTSDAKGDGKVNMRDFRRWRDWAADIWFANEQRMDGGIQHVKRDLNGNSVVQADTLENIYPRGDFNGDGRLDIDPTLRRRVPGVINASASDLEVFQSLFSDSNYVKGDLDNLIASGDLHMDATSCLGGSGIASVRSFVHPQGSYSLVEPSREHSTGTATQIYTVRVDVFNGTRFTLRMVAFDAAGRAVDSVAKDTVLRLAEDVRYKPACNGPVVSVSVNPSSATVGLGQTKQFNATVTGTTNTQVVWTTTVPGGSISGSGLLTAGQSAGTFEVRATSVADNTRSATAQVTVGGSAFEAGDIYVGTRRFQGTSNPFPVALIFNRQKTQLLQCVSPLSSNQPNEYRSICASVGGDFTAQSGYVLFEVSVSGDQVTGFAISGDGAPTSSTTIRLTFDGNKLQGRLDTPPNLFTTFDTTKR